MIKTTVTVTGKFPNLDEAFNRNVMLEIAQQIKKDIIVRTKAGKDQNQQSFIPYASSNKKKFGQVVDLTDSGQMLNSVTCKAQNGTSVIYVNNATADKKTGWNARHKNYERSYFGLSEQNINKIKAYFDRIIQGIFK